MNSDEVREVAVSLTTSALHAQGQETLEERIDAYVEDFQMLTRGLTGDDLYRLVSLLADINAHMISIIAEYQDVSPSTAMEYLAHSILEASSTDTYEIRSIKIEREEGPEPSAEED